MALIACHECGNQVSTEAAKCPGCGAKVKIPKKVGKPVSCKSILKGVGIFFVLMILVNAIGAYKQSQKTPEELKADTDAHKASLEQTAEEDKKFAVRFAREKTASIAALAIKQSSRNPESVTWVSILANDDASTVCFEVRAQNGFGGMNVEDIAVVNGTVKTSDAAWNKNCANKTLFDVKDEVIRMLKDLP